MPCRVGITTDPDRRKREWKFRHPTLKNWEIVSWHRTRSAAQQKEDEIAHSLGCDAHHGGAEPAYADWWYVYVFEHDG